GGRAGHPTAGSGGDGAARRYGAVAGEPDGLHDGTGRALPGAQWACLRRYADGGPEGETGRSRPLIRAADKRKGGEFPRRPVFGRISTLSPQGRRRSPFWSKLL